MPILTTHTGSLPRTESVLRLLIAQEREEAIDPITFEAETNTAVHAIVRQQRACGIDIIGDGEQSKISYATYAKERLSGFGTTDVPNLGRALAMVPDLVDFPEYAQHLFGASAVAALKTPVCVGPISYTGTALLHNDIAHLQAALQQEGVPISNGFLTAASPGILSLFLENQYYPSHEAYLAALADAMKVEYDTIYQAGLLLQVDCPDLAAAYWFMGENDNERRRRQQMHVEMLNYALRDIPPERLRMHVCWGTYEGPHHKDIPLRDIIDVVFQAHPAQFVFESATPRHDHEWQVFEEVKLPEGKILVPGIIDVTTNYIEHPELVAQRIIRFARLVGRERVYAGTSCGFASHAQHLIVDPKIAWAKLQSLVEGARLASQKVW